MTGPIKRIKSPLLNCVSEVKRSLPPPRPPPPPLPPPPPPGPLSAARGPAPAPAGRTLEGAPALLASASASDLTLAYKCSWILSLSCGVNAKLSS